MVKAITEISRSRKIAGTADCLDMIEMTAVFSWFVFSNHKYINTIEIR